MYFLTKKIQRQFNGKRILFSTNNAGKIGHLSAEKLNLDTIHILPKIGNSKSA